MSTKLGDKIRALRKERGLTLDELASGAGMSKSYLWELENRPAPKPSAEKLDALAKILGQPVAYFLEDEVTTPAEAHVDEAFFRNYKDLDASGKAVMRQIMESFKKSP
ncbi:Helix-turn-helix domain-containing protein [Pseudoxanthomonas sp. CF385]|uniref:helix-turn-helix domain-containing protein n=1 Tax=Pseudoxanthomonas sp. CF385 TaxID=1881042 RepID=UPI00088B8077|nr:helix-turn-helix transcriptional regulator [Pseudoxanthomonas sp. CF385]SDQ20055.1 Helix-turn-helix domain-containing protein [Pseudoxanthomonas sp. CF385]